MKHLTALTAMALVAVGAILLTACDEDTPTAGGSLVADEVVIVRDSSFTVSGHPVAVDRVRSRTTLQLLGRYSAQGYGTFSSDIVCQYMPAAAIDTFGVKATQIDSVKLCLTVYKGGFAGDSIAPMGLTVHPLTQRLPPALYSDTPVQGLYDPDSIVGQTSYSALIDKYPYIGADDNKALFKNIYVDLPVEFGRRLFDKYLTDPAIFNSPSQFADWFPGFYITNSFGSGRVTRINNNSIDVFYRAIYTIGTPEEPRDTVIPLTATYLGVTPEVLTNNCIDFKMSHQLKDRAASGETILVAPLGYEVEFTFPAREILRRYQENSTPLSIVNSLNFFIPAEDIDNDYGLNPPPYILLVKKSERDKFFAENKIDDSVSSFYATYNATTGGYTFSSMRDYINQIIAKGTVEADDEEFVICPVQVEFYKAAASSSYSYYYSYYSYYSNMTSGQVSAITPYVTEPAMVKLNFDKAKIDFIYSKQTFGK